MATTEVLQTQTAISQFSGFQETPTPLTIQTQNITGDARVHNGNYYFIKRSSTYSKNRDIFTWLSPLSFDKAHEEIRERAQFPREDHRSQENDYYYGKWFLDSPGFQQWQSRKTRELWCLGMPGAGKSVIASIIIKRMLDLQNSSNTGPQSPRIAYLYLSYKETYTLDQLLGSIINQVIMDPRTLPESLIKNWEQCKFGAHKPTLGALMDVLEELLRDHPIYIVVDALDEYPMEDRNQLLRRLRGFNNVSILITSRMLPEMETLANDGTIVDIKANPKDIDLFLDSKMKRSSRFKSFESESPGLLDEIKVAIRKACSEMFILASKHMETIESQDTTEKVRTQIRKLARNTNDQYSEIMDRIGQLKEDDKRLAFGILSWLLFSYRPLEVKELQHCMAVDLENGKFNENQILDESRMKELCEGLVTVTNGFISLVHYTAYSYLQAKRDHFFPGFRTTIARTCIVYLTLKGSEQSNDAKNQQFNVDDSYNWLDIHTTDVSLESPTWISYPETRAKFPFISYVAEFLPRHLRDMGTESVPDDILRGLQRLLQDRTKRNVLIRMMSDYYPQLIDTVPSTEPFMFTNNSDVSSSGVNIVSRKQVHWTDVSPVLSSSPIDYDDSHIESWDQAPRPSHPTQLPWKLWPSHDLSGESSDLKGTRETTALHLAVFLGWRPIVTQLLDTAKERIDVNAADSNGQTPLIIATREGHCDVVPALLDSGASIDLRSRDGHAVLLQAAQASQSDTVERVISDLILRTKHKVLHIKLVKYIVAVIIAFTLEVVFLISGYFPTSAQVGHAERQLVDRALHLLAPEKEDDTQFKDHLRLLQAVLSGECEAIRILVHNCRNQCKPGISYFHETAVFLAVEFGQTQAASILLNKGADINMRGLQNCTLLHRAAYQNNIEMVRMLLRHNPSINLKDDAGLTAWSANLDKEHSPVLEVLRNAGADTNTQRMHGETDLYSAAAAGKLATVRFLLNQGVNPSLQTDFGWAPLHWAAADGHLSCVEELLKAGAELDPVSDQSKSPLDMAIENNQQKVIKVLRDAGAKTALEVLNEVTRVR
ncbi:ankyrin repeat-containing domain protein [Aspergillus avenaceus]|uniref:Ankyrin repeat-containing domain protein n=1 Tax=Aspergillus avenaceus TaxID=36643 RepID=A0A5N6TJT5_ASPAV|nr:ankyrin repeat-containing domain protein [Aspergillus avenaceus]